ncbi:hypothetical protein BDZ89DRAFT_96531 [Hymenopellis radicata]|nr:hypothetical protein BDZ89DRAFT_96531 [Hymenopellis radicata]
MFSLLSPVLSPLPVPCKPCQNRQCIRRYDCLLLSASESDGWRNECCAGCSRAALCGAFSFLLRSPSLEQQYQVCYIWCYHDHAMIPKRGPMESQADLEQGFVGPLLGRWRRRKLQLQPSGQSQPLHGRHFYSYAHQYACTCCFI